MAEYQAQAKLHTDQATTSEPDADGKVTTTIPGTIDTSTITEMVTSDLPWNGWGVMWRHGKHDLLYPTVFDLREQAAAFISLRPDKETLRPVEIVVQAASAVTPPFDRSERADMLRLIHALVKRLDGEVTIPDAELVNESSLKLERDEQSSSFRITAL